MTTTAQPKSLFQKVWDAHRVRELPSGQTQLLIGTHLIHEVTSPQAFAMLRELKLPVRFPGRTFATVDHIIPTDDQSRPLADDLAEAMMSELERNCRDYGIQFFGPETGAQGIVHVIGPELGLTQPGMTIACGDSHTSTHGAFGAIAFGIGTSQVRDVLASQCLAIAPLKVRRIEVTGKLQPGVYAKDVILAIIRKLGVNGGVGYAYEYAGPVIDAMSMEERMTVCNMSIEGGARCGYVNPDRTTVEYLRGRRYTPNDAGFEAKAAGWLALASDPGTKYDDVVPDRRLEDRALDHLGHPPGPQPRRLRSDPDPERRLRRRARGRRGSARVHGLRRRRLDRGHADRRRLHRLVHQRPHLGPARGGEASRRPGHVKAGVRALVVPGSMAVREQAEAEGLDVDLPRGGLRVARAGLLDVPRDESRQAARPRGLRLVLEPQLQGPPGLAVRPHAADVAGHGRGRRDRRQGRRRPQDSLRIQP